jgi:hypothetical protein
MFVEDGHRIMLAQVRGFRAVQTSEVKRVQSGPDL